MVALVILLGVLLGRQTQIQADLHLGTVGLVIVDHPHPFHPLLDLIEVGGDQIAHAFELLPVFGLGQLLLLQGVLAPGALQRVFDQAGQLGPRRFCRWSRSRFFAIGAQQGGKIRHGLIDHTLPILGHGQDGEVHGLAVLRLRTRVGVQSPSRRRRQKSSSTSISRSSRSPRTWVRGQLTSPVAR